MERNTSFNRSSETKTASRISSFCSEESLPQRLVFLDQELSVYGYPSVQANNNVHKVALVNVTYDLLLLYRQTLESQSSITDELRNAESDSARSQHLLSLAREDVANKDRELKSKCIEEAHLHQRIETLRKKHKSEQEKCRRLSAEMLSRDTQYKHEKKKKLQELEKLQAKLHQLLQDKRHERMLGIEILNSLQRADGKRSKWNTDKAKKNNEQEMYRLIITNYEDSQKQLLNENADMRKYLKQMQDELISALNEKVMRSDKNIDISTSQHVATQNDSLDCEKKSSTSEESDASELMSEGVFEMPYEIVKDDIEKSLKSKWKALRKLHKHRSRSDEQADNQDSSEKTSEYEKLIKEQQDLIDYLTTSQDHKDGCIPSDSYFLEEKAELEKARATFYQQRLSFEKERKVYTEALLQLGEDRQTFEEEKSSWFQHKFMQLTPFQGQSTKKTKATPNSVRSLCRRGLSSSWNESLLKSYSDEKDSSPVHSARGVADGMGTSGGSPDSSPLVIRSPNLAHRFSSPEDLNPWSKTSPPVPSTGELYRALGLRYNGGGKENKDARKISSHRYSSASPSHQSGSRDRGATSSLRHDHRLTGDRRGRYVIVDDLKTALFQN